jgi:hypothetical protein
MRARSVKPGLFTNEQLADLPPLARLLFIGLWCLADKAGVLEDRPRRIKATVLPFDDVDVDELLRLLAAAGFIVRYEVAGQRCIFLPTFVRHQSPHPNEKSSELPPPPADSSNYLKCHEITCPSSSSLPSDSMPSGGLSSGPSGGVSSGSPPSEGCPEPAPPASEPAGSAPPGVNGATVLVYPIVGKGKKTWTLTTSKLAEYRESYPGVDVEAECRAALQWCRDNPTKRKTAGGMAAFLARWLKKEQNNAARTSSGSASRPSKRFREGQTWDGLKSFAAGDEHG